MSDADIEQENAVSAALRDDVQAAVEAEDTVALKALIQDLHESDVAELIAHLEPEQRVSFIRLLGDEFDFTALTEMDEALRAEILAELEPKAVAEGLADIDSDDAVYILEDLPDAESEAILAELPFAMRHRLKRSLDYPEESAGRRMQTDFVAMPPFWTVGQVIDALREEEDLPDSFTEIYVVDPAFKLMGTVKLDRLLRTHRPLKITDIMDDEPRTIQAEEDQEEAARIFQRYNLLSAAVVDEAGRLVGILTIDDIVDVIEAEADEDIRALAGAGDAELSDTPLYVARTRIPWLMTNMVTAFLASGVIALFDGTIAEMVALAILMPVVTALGGNAGIQAMTVTVRALSQKEITKRNVWRVIWREMIVALLNGSAVALAVGVVAALWFFNPELGVVIFAAIVFNIFCAGFFGVTLPTLLDRLGADPAVASSVFLTTITDVLGFLAFLGLASWWFGLG